MYFCPFENMVSLSIALPPFTAGEVLVVKLWLGVVTTLIKASKTGWQGLAACAVKQNDTANAVAAKPRRVDFEDLCIE
jgi:hypothetical protein